MLSDRGERERLLCDLQKSFSRAQRHAEEGLVRLGDEAVEGVTAILFSASADAYTRSFAFRVLERIGTPLVVPHIWHSRHSRRQPCTRLRAACSESRPCPRSG